MVHELHTTDFAKVGARRVGNNQVPSGNMVVLSILRPELCPAIKIGCHIAFYMPFRVATPATLLYIAGVSLMPEFPKGPTFDLGFFTRYQNIQVPHVRDLVSGLNT